MGGRAQRDRNRPNRCDSEPPFEIAESISRILTAGIPVMGHLGLTPQSIYKFGTYTVRAKEEEEANKLMEERINGFYLALVMGVVMIDCRLH